MPVHKYIWDEIENDKRTLHLNLLHKVNTCGGCKYFKNEKCISRKLIVNPGSQICDPDNDFKIRI